jgi:mono/diheme cytochrome c family protein
VKLVPFAATVTLGVGLALVLTAWAQSRPLTVLDGVYSDRQALAGHEQYEAICAACHEGDEPEALPPKGSDFIERWREAPLSFLYDFIRANMPGDKPASLTEADYINLTAYLLQANGYPSGPADLTTARTRDIALVTPDGPKPLPANALVRTIGCLTKTSTGDPQWTLTSATPPARVRTGDETTPAELAASKATPLDRATYALGNAEDFPAESLLGRKVQAKGVLTKVAPPYRLSLQSLQPLGDACVP